MAGLGPFKPFWATNERHSFGVLAWAKHGLSNVALQGNRSRSAAISQRGHGYDNPDNLVQTLFFSCRP